MGEKKNYFVEIGTTRNVFTYENYLSITLLANGAFATKSKLKSRLET